MAETPQEVPQDDVDLAEGYPTLTQVVRGIAADDTLPEVGVSRVEINAFASGDATCRAWILGEEEPRGFYLGQLTGQ
jgi:hypothetical protein